MTSYHKQVEKMFDRFCARRRMAQEVARKENDEEAPAHAEQEEQEETDPRGEREGGEMMTLKEAVAWKQAARSHEVAIAKPGARCASSPCAICASFGELYRLASDANLDDLKTAPGWLVEGIQFYRRYPSFYAEGRRAQFTGREFEFISPACP